MNVNLLKINERIKFQEYFDIFVSNGLFPKITYPTRFSKSEKRCNGTLIDHLFCKYLDGENCLSSDILISTVSDHLPYFVYLDMKKKSTVKTKLIKVYTNHENAMSNCQRDVVNSVNGIIFNNDLFGDPNKSYDKLENAIINAKNNNFQPKYVPFKKYKRKLSPWMTAGILRSIKFRDNMYRKFIKTDSNAFEYSALDNNLCIYKTILRKCIRLAKANYYANRLEQHKSDMRRTWSTINDILNKDRQRKVLPSYILVKAEIIVSPVEIANQFNNFFANIGRNL